jgi:tRNA threonylcarbamoyladenosine biosynthesis protein TsaE
MQVKTLSPEQTYALGQELATYLADGIVLCLEGDLGAGKTLFVQGIANGLKVTEEVTSPTFTIMNIYQGEKTIYHFDLYRLEFAEELQDIGFYEYTEQIDQVVILEWPDKFPDELPDEYLWIKISRSSGENERIFDIRLQGEKYKRVYEELKRSCQF